MKKYDFLVYHAQYDDFLEKLREIWGQYKICCFFHQDAQEAYHHLLSDRKEADIIYIAGSLYLIGQMKSLMRRIPDD